MASYSNRSAAALRYDRSMLQGDETIFLIPPSQSRRRNSAAALLYDCSMLQGDETIFLVRPDQSRRFAANGHDRPAVREPDRNLGLPQNGNDAPERRRMIAEHIRSKAVRDHAVDGDGVCVVCQDNLVVENRKIARLDCGHHYHQRCITNWLNVKNTCPLCQTTVI
ncbi:hypothetical protein AAHA92_16924 [Salvia divinorum]|uniref:RING-type E3 ubiquitin transferase n=1 Tax=Salvia divinorum TaxID=28513 RepID=A0ABD1GX52_SALDI